MPRVIRKVSKIWKQLEEQQIASGLKLIEWKRTYEAVCLALALVGLTMVMTKEEFDVLPIPLDTQGREQYMFREIIVSRNGIVSKPIRIQSLLSNVSSLMTEEELRIMHDEQAKYQSTIQKKGIASANNFELNTINKLHDLIGLREILQVEHLEEHRLGDVGYSLLLSDENNYFPDQAKTSKVGQAGRCKFGQGGKRMNIGHMLHYLERGMSLTCIGVQNDDIEVVWLFYGEVAINMLKNFVSTQRFEPKLYLERSSTNQFTNIYNESSYRFDVGLHESERTRLLDRIVQIVSIGKKYSLEFLNEDDSQIPSENHRIEFASYKITRDACKKFGVITQRLHEDSYGSVDFRVINARIQDKVLCEDRVFNFRGVGRHPYHPNKIDIMQITMMETKFVYAIPMRVLNDGLVTSHFSERELMYTSITMSNFWKIKHEKFLCDFNTDEGIEQYLRICDEATKIPSLSDETWYEAIITNNAEKFGSKKQLKARKNLKKD